MTTFTMSLLAAAGGGVLGALAVMEVQFRLHMRRYKRSLENPSDER